MRESTEKPCKYHTPLNNLKLIKVNRNEIGYIFANRILSKDKKESIAFNVLKTRKKGRISIKIHKLSRIHQYFVLFNRKMKENE